MARQSKKPAPKKKTAPKKKAPAKAAAPAEEPAQKAKPKRRPAKQTPPPKIIIRNARAAVADDFVDEDEQTMGERFDGMGGSHVAAMFGAGTAATALGVTMVGQGWIGPKLTAGLLTGSGLLASLAGYYWDSDHVMAAGVGMTTAGGFSLANQFAVDAYEAIERKAAEKRQEKEEAEASGGQRNGRRLVLLEPDGTRTELVERGDGDDGAADDDQEAA